MSDMSIEKATDKSMRSKVLIVGGVLGAAVGTLAAYLFVQNLSEDEPLEVTPGQGIRLALLVFGLLRSIASLGED
jgi:hypothetical protein